MKHCSTHLTSLKIVFVRRSAKCAVGEQFVGVVHDVALDLGLEEQDGRIGVLEGKPALSVPRRRREVRPTAQRQLVLLWNVVPVRDRRQPLAVRLVQAGLYLNKTPKQSLSKK